MRTRLLIFENERDCNEVGLLTDIDIFAMEGQTVFLSDKKYQIKSIFFVMTPANKMIDTEKHICLEEVAKE